MKKVTYIHLLNTLAECFFSLQQTNSFKLEAVSSVAGVLLRRPDIYQARTQNWNDDNLAETLGLGEDTYEGDDSARPFQGPIVLPPGTHAIPFSIRLPNEVNPSISYTRKKDSKTKAVVQHT